MIRDFVVPRIFFIFNLRGFVCLCFRFFLFFLKRKKACCSRWRVPSWCNFYFKSHKSHPLIIFKLAIEKGADWKVFRTSEVEVPNANNNNNRLKWERRDNKIVNFSHWKIANIWEHKTPTSHAGNRTFIEQTHTQIHLFECIESVLRRQSNIMHSHYIQWEYCNGTVMENICSQHILFNFTLCICALFFTQRKYRLRKILASTTLNKIALKYISMPYLNKKKIQASSTNSNLHMSE